MASEDATSDDIRRSSPASPNSNRNFGERGAAAIFEIDRYIVEQVTGGHRVTTAEVHRSAIVSLWWAEATPQESLGSPGGAVPAFCENGLGSRERRVRTPHPAPRNDQIRRIGAASQHRRSTIERRFECPTPRHTCLIDVLTRST